MGKKGDLSDFELCMVADARQAGLSISETTDRKGTVTQTVTTCYNQGLQKSISERTAHPTLKQIGYSSRPHRVPQTEN